MDTMDKQFWDERYQSGQTGWDMGMVSPPLKAYIDQIADKHQKILIPGAGNSYEALYLLEREFTDITVLDIAPTVVQRLKDRTGHYPQERLHVVEGDFFQHTGSYDLIFEQTFFCALNPSLRGAYVDYMHTLLKPGGKLVGVLFNRMFATGSPPYGGHKDDYEKLFAPYFDFHTWAHCINSHPSRLGSEWFMILKRPLPALV